VKLSLCLLFPGIYPAPFLLFPYLFFHGIVDKFSSVFCRGRAGSTHNVEFHRFLVRYCGLDSRSFFRRRPFRREAAAGEPRTRFAATAQILDTSNYRTNPGRSQPWPTRSYRKISSCREPRGAPSFAFFAKGGIRDGRYRDSWYPTLRKKREGWGTRHPPFRGASCRAKHPPRLNRELVSSQLSRQAGTLRSSALSSPTSPLGIRPASHASL
jgi:hypothetical protein